MPRSRTPQRFADPVNQCRAELVSTLGGIEPAPQPELCAPKGCGRWSFSGRRPGRYLWAGFGAVLMLAIAMAVAGEAGAGAVAAAVTPQALDRVWATSPDADHGKVLYLRHCRECHGGHAWGDGPRSIPSLAGQREKYLIEQLAQFAVGQRAGPSMHETMRRPDLDWAQAVRDLAAYLASVPRSPGPEHGDSSDVSAGKRLYQLACRDCHGGNGEGSAAGVPAIGGQHYRYLAAQLSTFASGHRDAAEPRLPVSMGALSPTDIQDIANYVSRLSYLTADGAR